MHKWKPFRKLKTIYWQNFVLAISAVSLALTFLGTAFLALSYHMILSQRSLEIREKAEDVSSLFASAVYGNAISGMQELAGFAAEVTDVDFLICNRSGQVLLTSDENLVSRVLTLPEEIRDEVLEKGIYSKRSSIRPIYDENKFVVAVPIEHRGKLVGITVAVTDAGALATDWRSFLGTFLIVSVIVLLFAFVLSAWMSVNLASPIREMTAITRLFAQGKFDVRMRTHEVQEIGELAAAFNSMADSLQETERQRREFIANISHELKTPMTTIAGYTDGILDGTIPPEREKQYLRIISDESRRLSRLVRRMLEVSQLQSRELLHMSPFDICESMRRVLISMERKITARGLDVEAVIPDEPVMVLGDNDLITQVIYNLLENAAKFAYSESTLRLGLTIQNGHAVIGIQNEGDTISAEELPLLFERFHKSDKSRSEDKDGVGLGLYIVRTILEQHGEKIVATSENGITTFSFTLLLAGNDPQSL